MESIEIEWVFNSDVCSDTNDGSDTTGNDSDIDGDSGSKTSIFFLTKVSSSFKVLLITGASQLCNEY